DIDLCDPQQSPAHEAQRDRQGQGQAQAEKSAQVDVPHAESLSAPDLDRDPGYSLPHAQHQRVRRLEDLIYSAQPHGRMTARGLMRVLGEVAEDRPSDPDRPELSHDLRSRIAEAA